MCKKKNKEQYVISVDGDDCLWGDCTYDSVQEAVKECKGDIEPGSTFSICELVPVTTIEMPEEPIVTMLVR